MIGNRFGSSLVVRAAAAAAALAAAAAMPAVAAAQQGGIMGTIVADSGGKPVGGATIRLPQLNRGARTNWTGDFVIEQLPAGKYYAIVEAPGFAAESIDVELPASGTINHDFKLKRGAPGTAATVGAAGSPTAGAPVTMAARLQAFETRRAQNKGLYVTRDKLAKGGRLMDVLRPIVHGARFQSFPDGSTKLVSSRQTSSTSLGDQTKEQPCFVQVWIDGTAIGGGNAGATAPSMSVGRSFEGTVGLQTGEMGIDFNPLEASQYDGIEYYSDPGSTPPEYRANGGRCGTLLLWTHVE